MWCLGKTEWEEGEEEFYYTSRKLYQHMKYSYRKKPIVRRPLWCNLVTGHTTITIGVVYRCPNITIQNNEKIHNDISEASKGDCIIMGDFNHGTHNRHRGRGPKVVFVRGTGQFLNSTCIRTNQSRKSIIYSAILTEGIRRQRCNTITIGQQRS